MNLNYNPWEIKFSSSSSLSLSLSLKRGGGNFKLRASERVKSVLKASLY